MRAIVIGFAFGFAVAGTLFAAVGPKPESDRSIHREATVAASWERTQFDCRDGTACWDVAGYQLCTDYILRFNPPMTSIVALKLMQPAGAMRDRPGVHCWTPGEDVGDETQGFLLEPADPMEPGEIYEEARMRFTAGPGGVAACRIYGEVVEFIVWEL